MAVSYRDYAQVFSSASSSSITIPASVQVGDLLIMEAAGGWGPTVPAGWSSQYSNNSASNIRGFVATRVAQAGDAGSNVSITWQSNYNHVINLIAVTGGTTIRSGAIFAHGSTGGNATLGPITAAADDMIVYLGANRQDGGPPSITHGTTVVSAADGSTIAAGIIAYEAITSGTLATNIFTTASQGSGYLYSALVVSGGGTPPNYAVIESNYVESLLTAQAAAQIESNYAEVLRSHIDVRVESNYAEVLANGVYNAQVQTVYAEALIRSAQLQTEAVYAEALSGGTPNLQTEAVYAEALSGGTPNLQTEGVYAEVLVSLTVFPNRRGWGIVDI